MFEEIEVQKHEIQEKLSKLLNTNIKVKDLMVKDNYTLKVTQGSESGSLFFYSYEFEIVHGDAIVLRLAEDYTQWGGYTTFLVVPLELGTVIKERYYSEQSGSETSEDVDYYIFTKNGWVKVEVE